MRKTGEDRVFRSREVSSFIGFHCFTSIPLESRRSTAQARSGFPSTEPILGMLPELESLRVAGVSGVGHRRGLASWSLRWQIS